jgi:spore coat protein A, manganese oxidase
MYPDQGDGGHPFWVKEFFGDVAVVNGKVWPYLNVERRRYRFHVLNGSSTRTYMIQLQTTSGAAGPAMWQIGTDGGLLNTPVQITQLCIAPGERIDLIVDFAGKSGTSVRIQERRRDAQHLGVDVDFRADEDQRRAPAERLGHQPQSCGRPEPAAEQSHRAALADREGRTGAGRRAGGRGSGASTLTRHMTVEKDRSGGGFLLNGLKWDDTITETPRIGSTEVWQIDNPDR